MLSLFFSFKKKNMIWRSIKILRSNLLLHNLIIPQISLSPFLSLSACMSLSLLADCFFTFLSLSLSISIFLFFCLSVYLHLRDCLFVSPESLQCLSFSWTMDLNCERIFASLLLLSSWLNVAKALFSSAL